MTNSSSRGKKQKQVKICLYFSINQWRFCHHNRHFVVCDGVFVKLPSQFFFLHFSFTIKLGKTTHTHIKIRYKHAFLQKSLLKETVSQVLPLGRALDHRFCHCEGDNHRFSAWEGDCITGSLLGKNTRSQVLPLGRRLDHRFSPLEGAWHRFSHWEWEWITGSPLGKETRLQVLFLLHCIWLI